MDIEPGTEDIALRLAESLEKLDRALLLLCSHFENERGERVLSPDPLLTTRILNAKVLLQTVKFPLSARCSYSESLLLRHLGQPLAVSPPPPIMAPSATLFREVCFMAAPRDLDHGVTAPFPLPTHRLQALALSTC